MLVLSRRPHEDIVFPNTGIRVRLLQVKGNVARIGIEAPPEIQVFRAELAQAAEASNPPAGSVKFDHHALRNRLNKVTLGLHQFQQQLQSGLTAEASTTFERILEVLDALDRDWPTLTRQRPETPTVRSERCRMLLVEDDDNERELLAGLLGMNGCDCQTAADGQDALDYLASHELPDFVLLDMGLPRLSGQQFLSRIRQETRSKQLKVFAIRGNDPKELGIEIGQGGVDAWFNKPLNPRRLWAEIQQRLHPHSTVN